MIPDIIATIFLILPWACLWYVFRGMSSSENPIWGNLIAAALGGIVAGVVAIWFFSGTIVTPHVVSNLTYQFPNGTDQSSVMGSSLVNNVLEEGGVGMFDASPILTITVGNTTLMSANTFDIVYVRYQDFGLMFLYMLMTLIFIALFAWFVYEARKILNEESEALMWEVEV